jgi:shikimate 5-dehydrogenase
VPLAPRPPPRPTLWFLGVTTGSSSIQRVFPAWAGALGLDAAVRGVDLPPGASAEAYRELVRSLLADPLARGALVTTHKIDLYHACTDLFDEIRPDAARLGEASCLVKAQERLLADATDVTSSALALAAFLPKGHWRQTRAGVLCLGAGGAARAILWHLIQGRPGIDAPARIAVADVAAGRLEALRHVVEHAATQVPVEWHHATGPEANDALLTTLQPGSLVINATGLGKDRPGSPLTDAALFPMGGYAWELNYRGDLRFLHQALAQAGARELTVEDGWTYFVHGWTRVVALVFGLDIPTTGPGFERLSRLAREATGRG